MDYRNSNNFSVGRFKDQRIEQLQRAISVLCRAESCLRNGQVIYAYRHMGYLVPLLGNDPDKMRVHNRIVVRLRKGEQLDAHAEITSLLDRISNEIRKIQQEKSSENAVSSGPQKDPSAS